MSAKVDVEQQIESKTEELTALKSELKALKAQAKSLDKDIDKLQAAKTAQDAAEAEAAQGSVKSFAQIGLQTLN